MKHFPFPVLAAGVLLLAAASLVSRRAGEIMPEPVSLGAASALPTPTGATGIRQMPAADIPADLPPPTVTKPRNRPARTPAATERPEISVGTISHNPPTRLSRDFPSPTSPAPSGGEITASAPAAPAPQAGRSFADAGKTVTAALPEHRRKSVAAALAHTDLHERTPHERLAVEQLAIWEESAPAEPAADATANATVSDEYLRITLGQDRFNQLSFLASRTESERLTTEK